MTIAVTGATGILGSEIVRTLVQAGHSVIALRRENSDTHILHDIQEHISWRTGDVEDITSLDDVFNGATLVVHAAALVSYNSRDKEKLYKANVVGTENVVNACLKLGIQLIHISSVASISRTKTDTVLDESHHWVENPDATAYGRSKYLAELEVVRGQEEGLQAVILNPSVILSASTSGRSSAKLFDYLWKERPFYIKGEVNYVDVNDVADIVQQLVNANHWGERYIVNAGNVTYQRLFEMIAAQLGKRPPRILVSSNLVNLAGRISSAAALLLGTDPLITREIARASKRAVLYDNRKITSVLNFSFQPLEKTIERCCKHYVEGLHTKKLDRPS